MRFVGISRTSWEAGDAIELTALERKVIRRRVGLGGERQSVADIARRMKMHPQNVRAILARTREAAGDKAATMTPRDWKAFVRARRG